MHPLPEPGGRGDRVLETAVRCDAAGRLAAPGAGPRQRRVRRPSSPLRAGVRPAGPEMVKEVLPVPEV